METELAVTVGLCVGVTKACVASSVDVVPSSLVKVFSFVKGENQLFRRYR